MFGEKIKSLLSLGSRGRGESSPTLGRVETALSGPPTEPDDSFSSFNLERPPEEMLNLILLQCIHDRAVSFKLELSTSAEARMYYQIGGQWYEMHPPLPEHAPELAKLVRQVAEAPETGGGQFTSDNTIEGLGCVMTSIVLEVVASSSGETLTLSFEISEGDGNKATENL